jgi:hypothetical protein
MDGFGGLIGVVAEDDAGVGVCIDAPDNVNGVGWEA